MRITHLEKYSLDDIKREMSRLVRDSVGDIQVRNLADKAVERVSYLNSDSQFIAVNEFVRATFPYQPDPQDTEMFISPARVADDYFKGKIHRLDCDDMAMLTTSMLRSIGHRARIVILDTDGLGYNHCITQAYSPTLNDWINLDPSSRFPTGWEESYTKRIIIE